MQSILFSKMQRQRRRKRERKDIMGQSGLGKVGLFESQTMIVSKS